jgi:hypothetical protein
LTRWQEWGSLVTSVSDRGKLVLICTLAGCLSVLASQGVGRWLGLIIPPFWVTDYGAPNRGRPVAVVGTSLCFHALDLEEFSTRWDRAINTVGTGNASPCELEWLGSRIPQAECTLIALSVYDFNENLLSDQRPQIVPLLRTLQDLKDSRADWAFAKRLVGQYPLSYLRRLFPTAGMSQALLNKLRDQARTLTHRNAPAAEERLTLTVRSDLARTEKISDWTSGRTVRNLTVMRTSFQGKHTFGGPKFLALRRMLARASPRRQMAVVVLPVSAVYEQAFLSVARAGEFERAIACLQKEQPEVRWVRLDQIPQLHACECYWDLVHLNAQGRALATPMALNQLKGWADRQ